MHLPYAEVQRKPRNLFDLPPNSRQRIRFPVFHPSPVFPWGAPPAFSLAVNTFGTDFSLWEKIVEQSGFLFIINKRDFLKKSLKNPCTTSLGSWATAVGVLLNQPSSNYEKQRWKFYIFSDLGPLDHVAKND